MQPLKIAVSGSSGLVGEALIARLRKAQHKVIRIQRGGYTIRESDVFWDPDNARIEKDKLEGLDVVVHLAGENVATGRWSAQKKLKIRESREKGTSLLCEALASLKTKPKLLISASAIGIYGNRADQILTEESGAGSGFLAEAGQVWEAVTHAAKEAGIGTIIARIGVVLSPNGGALGKMLPPFKLGLGGRLGNGRQWMSWIAIQDLIAAFEFFINSPCITGTFNLVAPSPVTNAEFTKTLGKVLKRPAIFPVPAPLLKLILGEMAEELLLSSTRVSSEKLCKAGFQFQFPELKEALQAQICSNSN